MHMDTGFDGVFGPCWTDKLSDFIKNILICVLKMNEGLTGLERHEGESFSFWGELSFKNVLALPSFIMAVNGFEVQ